MNYTGIYAQVWALYRHGFRYWFTQEENEALNRYNERFSAPILERDLLLQYFSVPQPTQTSQWMSLGEIIERINLHVKQALAPARLGQILRQEHFVCKRVKRGMIYLVHAKSEDENRLTDEREGTVLNGGESLRLNGGEPSEAPPA